MRNYYTQTRLHLGRDRLLVGTSAEQDRALQYMLIVYVEALNCIWFTG
jgi:hypothetical protein